MSIVLKIFLTFFTDLSFYTKHMFNLFYVNFNDLEDFLKKAIDDGNIDINIGREMIQVVDVYHEVYGG